MPYSHHSHSGQFCKHATGLLEDVVKEAINQGFEVYGLTEHVPRYRAIDLYAEEKDISVESLMTQFEAFLNEATRLRDGYASALRLLIGLETEYISALDLEGLSKILKAHKGRIDYIVGSVHHVNEIPIDVNFDTYQRCLDNIIPPIHPADSTEADQGRERLGIFLETYLDAQFDLLSKFHPEIIGHIDLCRLYTPDLRFGDFPRAWDKLERNIKFAIAYGALFEANAAALRKGWRTAYPGEDVAELILLHGGRFALSDDSHGPHAVALNYLPTRDYLLRIGVRELWTLERTSDPNAGGRHTAPVRVNGNWWDHAFWVGK
ncbi:histidinol-phosphatase [Russula earlei]|uniref:Histidinol-phosphatase n=1 Tax=Russula earlei TaxID=71964 RepID=A0ACC0UI97_9AGAM|nr:histidinol-phosphatase [Russula earlei]